MKKKECPSCAMEIDADSKTCPVCSYEFTTSGGSRRWIAAFLLILVVVWMILQMF